MSTLIALLLVLGTLSGCAGGAMLNVKNAPPDSGPVYVVELQDVKDSIQNSRGETVAEYACQVPVLSVMDCGGNPAAGKNEAERNALEHAAAFNAQFDQWRDVSGAMEELAASSRDFEEMFSFTAAMTEELTCSVYQTDHFISISGEYYAYTGGAHGNTMLLSWNFDLETGRFFDPQLLASKSDLQTAVYEELVKQSEAVALDNEQFRPEEYFWPDYTETLKNWSSYAVSFDKTGMTVGFSPYELACYAAGPQRFHISYEVLCPHLDRDACRFLGLDT